MNKDQFIRTCKKEVENIEASALVEVLKEFLGRSDLYIICMYTYVG